MKDKYLGVWYNRCTDTSPLIVSTKPNAEEQFNLTVPVDRLTAFSAIQTFWNDEVSKILSEFNKHNYTEGICKILGDIGIALKQNFPYDKEDINELPDGIVFGK